jgi:hypothetical protein
VLPCVCSQVLSFSPPLRAALVNERDLARLPRRLRRVRHERSRETAMEAAPWCGKTGSGLHHAPKPTSVWELFR